MRVNRVWFSSFCGVSLIFGSVLALASNHITYSFIPTDDGYFLGGARRIIAGEIPHRDFFFNRPALSYYIHAVWYLFPDFLRFYAAKASYYLCHVISALAVFFVCLHRNISSVPQSLLLGFLLSSSVMLAINNYTPMPWYTIDGIMISSVGLMLVGLASSRSRVACKGVGLGMASLAGWTKQNFFLPASLALLALVLRLSPWRLRSFFALVAVMAAPSLLILAFVEVYVGVGEFVRQISISSDTKALSGLLTGELNPLRYDNSLALVTGSAVAFILFTLSSSSSFRFHYIAHVVALFVLVGAPTWVTLSVHLSEPSRTSIWLLFFCTGLLLVESLAALGRRGVTGGVLAWQWGMWGVACACCIAYGIRHPLFAMVAMVGLVYSMMSRCVRNYSVTLWSGVLCAALSWVFTFHTVDNWTRERPYLVDNQVTQRYNLQDIFPQIGFVARAGARQYLQLYQVNQAVAFARSRWPGQPLTFSPYLTVMYFLLNQPNPLPFDLLMHVEFRGYEHALEKRLRERKPVVVLQLSHYEPHTGRYRLRDVSAFTEMVTRAFRRVYCNTGVCVFVAPELLSHE